MQRKYAVTLGMGVLAMAVAWRASAQPQNEGGDKKPSAPLVVNVKVSHTPFTAMGAQNKVPTKTPDENVCFLTVTLINVSGKPQKSVKLECMMYKLDAVGQRREMLKKTESFSLAQMEKKEFVFQGKLGVSAQGRDRRYVETTTRDEKFDGYSLRIFLDGMEVFEKHEPPKPKGTAKTK